MHHQLNFKPLFLGFYVRSLFDYYLITLLHIVQFWSQNGMELGKQVFIDQNELLISTN